ncbi:MAG: C45 family peptidase [Pseudomonadota bacterium]
MSNDVNDIGWCVASGTRQEIGETLGRHGKHAVQTHLVRSDIWAQVTSTIHDPVLARVKQRLQRTYPGSLSELEGMATGLDLPFRDVLAWNCRGDILASVPDGCTTVQLPGDDITIAHNEDGLPFFRGSCFIADVKPADGLAFYAFCYPGSIPGHTFAWNDAGLVMTVNNMRLLDVQAETSRMVICREALSAISIDDTVEKLKENPNCGGFHMSLAQVGDPRLLSVEYGAGAASVRPVTKASLHANHALHLCHHNQQITQSSRDRQQRGTELLEDEHKDSLEILRDASGAGLPIWRNDPNDPDHENTLATSIFHVSNNQLHWKIYNSKSGDPTYSAR